MAPSHERRFGDLPSLCWLARFRGLWEHKLEALATEVARGKRRR